MITSPNPIRTARKTRGWTQERLAEIAGVTAKTVYRLERGENLRDGNARRIHEALGLAYAPDIAEDVQPGIKLIPFPGAANDGLTPKMLGNLPAGTRYLARVDQKAWVAALSRLSWLEAVRVTRSGPAMAREFFGTPVGWSLAVVLAIALVEASVTWAPTVSATTLRWHCTGFATAFALLLWSVYATILRLPYGGAYPKLAAVALGAGTLTTMTVRGKKLRLRYHSLDGAIIDAAHHDGLASYALRLRREDLRIVGVPIDPAFEQALLAHDTGRPSRSVPMESRSTA